MIEDDEMPDADAFEQPEVDSPLRAGMALCAMCASVLRRVPTLEHVEGALIRHLPDGGARNWELASVDPRLDERQWTMAIQAIEPWRSRYTLADGANASKVSSNRRRTPLSYRDLPAAQRRES